MNKSPFKFLDSYTKDDREIFFGRDREIEELYQKVFDSKLLLVYGVSGTGKSSLIHCGLANKFNDTDWLPLVVRRGSNIIDSTASAIKSASVTPQEGQFTTPAQFRKGVRSLYLDHYKPVFFIFDQFEELFIFGDKEERKSFVQIVKSLIDSDLQCRLIFVMREEYMAGITEFERYIPTFFANRVRIEKMSHINALDAITKPCKVYNINLEEGFAEALLEKLSPDQSDVELTYLQVFLDKIFRSSANEVRSENDKNQIKFTLSHLNKAGNVSDLLGSFLDEQVALLMEPTTGLTILKCFVSLKGTRKQISEQEISDTSLTFGKDVSVNVLQEYLHQFINLRILKEKNEEGKYELRHDALAEKIFGKISMMEKELLEVLNFLETANQQFEKRGAYLSESDLKYIQYFDDKRIFKSNQKLSDLIESSKKYHTTEKRKRRQIVTSLALGVIIILGALSIWAISQRSKAITQKNIAEKQKAEVIMAGKLMAVSMQEAQTAKENADKARLEADTQKSKAEASEKTAQIERNKALNAKTIAENELYKNIKNSLSIAAEGMNVLYLGMPNPISVTVSGIPSERLEILVDNGRISNEKVFRSDGNYFDGNYTVFPGSYNPLTIKILGVIKNGKKDTIGSKVFRVRAAPNPYAVFAGKNGGDIFKASMLAQIGVFINLAMDFDFNFTIVEFVIMTNPDSIPLSSKSSSYLLTPEQKAILKSLERGASFSIDSIKGKGPDGRIREFPSMTFYIK